MMRGPTATVEERRAPHGALLAVVVGVVVAGPFLMGDHGKAIVGVVPELLGPAGLLLLPLALILAIRFLSNNNNNFSALSDALSYAGGSPESFHRVGGSPVGVALLLLLIVALLYYRVSLFGAVNDSE